MTSSLLRLGKGSRPWDTFQVCPPSSIWTASSSREMTLDALNSTSARGIFCNGGRWKRASKGLPKGVPASCLHRPRPSWHAYVRQQNTSPAHTALAHDSLLLISQCSLSELNGPRRPPSVRESELPWSEKQRRLGSLGHEWGMGCQAQLARRLEARRAANCWHGDASRYHRMILK